MFLKILFLNFEDSYSLVFLFINNFIFLLFILNLLFVLLFFNKLFYIINTIFYLIIGVILLRYSLGYDTLFNGFFFTIDVYKNPFEWFNWVNDVWKEYIILHDLKDVPKELSYYDLNNLINFMRSNQEKLPFLIQNKQEMMFILDHYIHTYGFYSNTLLEPCYFSLVKLKFLIFRLAV